MPPLKQVWIRVDGIADADERKRAVTRALESGFERIIAGPGDSSFRGLGRMELVTSPEERFGTLEIRCPEDQERIRGMSGDVIVSTHDWKVIPLENMVAGSSDGGARILCDVDSPEEARLCLGVLERGVDGIVINIRCASDVDGYSDVIRNREDLELSVLTVEDVRSIGMGDRVCVDTVAMMSPGQGMLCGSRSSCLFLVQSESEENGYVDARPFMVNAGAVHSYTMVPGGRTRYLSELRAGDPVLIVDRDGGARRCAVGRCKIERRPLLMVTASLDGRRSTVVLQNAETVRIVGPDGSLPVTELKAGDAVLGLLGEGGRHFGTRIDETVREVR